MKKYIALLLSFYVTSPVYAEWTTANCTNRGGDIVTGVKNGITFCTSKVIMNWWSANVWCQKHGGQLANIEHICPGAFPAVESSASCPNVNQGDLFTTNSARYFWLNNTSVEEGVVRARTIYRGANAVSTQWQVSSSLNFAVCE